MIGLLGFLAVATGAEALPPEQAAGKALMSCVKHASGLLGIAPENQAPLALDGLAYEADPPPFLRSMAQTPYGKGEFAGAPASEGQAWAVGYDSGTCIVMVVGTPVEPVEQRLTAMFNIPGSWQQERIEQKDAGSRWSQYAWKANGRRLIAQMKVQPLASSSAKGMVMVTIVPDKKN